MEQERYQKGGLIIDDLGYNKYRVRVDGSGRVTDRNRQFLRQFTPSTPVQPGPRSVNQHYPEPVVEPTPPVPIQTPPVAINPEPFVHPTPQTPERPNPEPVVQSTPDTPGSPSFATPPMTPTSDTPPRRSTRMSKPPDRWGYDKF